MRDYSSAYQRNKKVAANRVKVQKKPVDYSRYLRPLLRFGGYVAAGVAAIAVLWAGFAILQKTVLFRIKNIDVSSTRHLTRDEIIAIADVSPGRDLLRFSLRKAGEQIARNPWVETVRIRRYFPDTLSIQIIEREPLAVANIGYLYYLDRKGDLFKVINQGDRLDYPVITGFSEEELATDPSVVREGMKKAGALLLALKEKGTFILADVSEIHYDRTAGFTLFTASGALPVRIGTDEFAAKLERFASIYRDLMAQKPSLRLIDLDYQDRIVVTKG